MKIGIDARFFNESGVGRYLRNLIENLKVLDRDNQYFVFLMPKDIDEFRSSKNFQKVEADFRWYGFAEQFKFPNLIKQYDVNLMHFPHFNAPLFYPGKFAVTIHDLIHQHHSMSRATTLNPFTFKIKQIGYRKVFKNAAQKAEKVLVPSKSVQQLLISEWRIEEEKIIITPEAVDDKIIKLSQAALKSESQRILNKFNITKPFIFYVGNAHPHKNVEGLIAAFMKLKEKYSSLKLVLSGNDHFFWQRIKSEYQNPAILYTGFISDEELVALYKGAEVFVLPSFEEGFGIPILEAMACCCPVAASNVASLPEVGGDAAIYFNPKNIDDMIEKILGILNKKHLRKELINKGQKRVKLFSWKKLAEQTLEVYKACG